MKPGIQISFLINRESVKGCNLYKRGRQSVLEDQLCFSLKGGLNGKTESSPVSSVISSDSYFYKLRYFHMKRMVRLGFLNLKTTYTKIKHIYPVVANSLFLMNKHFIICTAVT